MLMVVEVVGNGDLQECGHLQRFLQEDTCLERIICGQEGVGMDQEAVQNYKPKLDDMAELKADSHCYFQELIDVWICVIAIYII